jgi:hypothetical protein
MGVKAARDKTSLKAFGGDLTIAQFRRGFLCIDTYDWILAYYSPRDPFKQPLVQSKYLYTLEPVRKTLVVDEEDEDPVVLIKQRVYG